MDIDYELATWSNNEITRIFAKYLKEEINYIIDNELMTTATSPNPEYHAGFLAGKLFILNYIKDIKGLVEKELQTDSLSDVDS
jgi:hypothetical protein